MNNYLSVFYMDAQRDVVEDLRDRKSYFGKATSRIELLPTDIQDIESQLNAVNVKIVDSIPALRQTADRIGSIASTIGSSNGTIEIEPLARKVADLHKGMDIFFKDGEAARLSIAQHGMGTRSWISFLTLGAYVEKKHCIKMMKKRTLMQCLLWRNRKPIYILKLNNNYIRNYVDLLARK